MVSVLIIKISSAGDIIHSTAIIKGLKDYFSGQAEVRIDMVIDPQYINLVKPLNFIGNFYFFPEKEYSKKMRKFSTFFSPLADICKTIKKIRNRHYNYIFDLQGIEKSLIFYLLSGTRGKSKAKKSCKWSLPYKSIRENKTMHAVKAMEASVRRIIPDFNAGRLYTPVIRPQLQLQTPEKRENGLPESGYCIIAPFTRWDTKNFPLIYYFILACHITGKYGKKVIFTGAPAEKEKFTDEYSALNRYALDYTEEGFGEFLTVRYSSPLIKEKVFSLPDNFFIPDGLTAVPRNILKTMAEYVKENKWLFMFGDFTLDELPYVYAHSDLFFGGDSMNLFLADSADAKIICFYGPTIPGRTGPYNTKPPLIRNENTPCLGCMKRRCPRKGKLYRECFYDLDLNIIFEQTDKILG